MSNTRTRTSLGSNRLFKTMKTYELPFKPVTERTLSIEGTCESMCLMKVRAKSLAKKRDSDVGLLEKAIVDDYQSYIQSIQAKTQSKKAMHDDKIVIRKRQIECRTAISPQRDLKCKCENKRSIHINIGYTPTGKTLESAKSSSSDIKGFQIEQRSRSTTKLVKRATIYDIHDANEMARLLFENTLRNMELQTKLIPRMQSTFYNPYRRIFGYRGKRVSYYHLA